MDQEGGGDDAIKELDRAVSLGWVSKSTVDAAFRRLFRVRIRLGMLDPPSVVSYNFISNSSLYVASGDHLALARRAAEQAMTLLVNRNGALPLRVLPKQGESGHNDSSDDADRTRTLALIGPQIHMTDLLLGNYAVPPDLGVVSIFSGIRSLLYDLEGPAYTTELLWSPGCATVPCEEDDLFPKAVALAQDSKVEAVIVTLGLDQSLEAETLDREDLDLPGYQYELVHQLRKAVDASNEKQALEGKSKKKPKVLIGVLIHGGTVRLGPILDDLDGLIDAW
jgi:beta-glucosidase-like glycosyl hydrolase